MKKNKYIQPTIEVEKQIYSSIICESLVLDPDNPLTGGQDAE